jgi:hypothetical protein
MLLTTFASCNLQSASCYPITCRLLFTAVFLPHVPCCRPLAVHLLFLATPQMLFAIHQMLLATHQMFKCYLLLAVHHARPDIGTRYFATHQMPFSILKSYFPLDANHSPCAPAWAIAVLTRYLQVTTGYPNHVSLALYRTTHRRPCYYPARSHNDHLVPRCLIHKHKPHAK